MAEHDPFYAADETVDAASDPATKMEPQPRTTPEAASGDHLENMRRAQLVALCNDLGLDTTGGRRDLIQRIRDHQR